MRPPDETDAVDVRPARDAAGWRHAADLLFAYQRETAVEVGAEPADRPEEVWLPVRQETVDPASVHSDYFVAYRSGCPVGGVALVAHDGLSAMIKRCYVMPSWRRRGVATALVEVASATAADRGVVRIVLDVLPSRTGAIEAWRRMGFVEVEPWADPSMVYFARPLDGRHRRAWLGVRHGEVVLHEGDARWHGVFAHQAEVLQRALGNTVTGIEHVGSTAVRGMLAKPIVDVAVRVRQDADERGLVAALEAMAYEWRGDHWDSGGFLFVLEDEPLRRIVHLHVVREGDPQWERYLSVRDRLRSDRAARDGYGALKRDLARRFPQDRRAYTAGKAAFIEELLGTSKDGP